MKTYEIDFLKNIERFSLMLNTKLIKSTFHKTKVWYMFNDSIAEKELYIFQENGSLLIIKDGRTSNGIWKYNPTKRAISLTLYEKEYIAHIAFIDSTIIALQIDGTLQYILFINERNKDNFHPRLISDVKNYFILKEEKFLEEESKKQKRLLQEKENEIRENIQNRLIEQANRIKEKNQIIPDAQGIKGWFFVFVMISIGLLVICGIISRAINQEGLDYNTLRNIYLIAFILSSIRSIVNNFIENKNIVKWITKNPDSPINKYL